MLAVLVRVQDTKELVGFFWGQNVADIWYTVDEFCDPCSCEYRVMDYGGIFYHDGAPKIAKDAAERGEEHIFTALTKATTSFSERTGMELHESDGRKEKWKLFSDDPDRPGKRMPARKRA